MVQKVEHNQEFLTKILIAYHNRLITGIEAKELATNKINIPITAWVQQPPPPIIKVIGMQPIEWIK